MARWAYLIQQVDRCLRGASESGELDDGRDLPDSGLTRLRAEAITARIRTPRATRGSRVGLRASTPATALTLSDMSADLASQLQRVDALVKRPENRPNWTIGSTSCTRNSNNVTTPKLPPPPRNAQNTPASDPAQTIAATPLTRPRAGRTILHRHPDRRDLRPGAAPTRIRLKPSLLLPDVPTPALALRTLLFSLV